jgi:hypothetical protein
MSGWRFARFHLPLVCREQKGRNGQVEKKQSEKGDAERGAHV